jgi:hypothetical protein
MRHVYPAWQALKAPADQGSDELTAARRAADPPEGEARAPRRRYLIDV